jgi:hypothetical protein
MTEYDLAQRERLRQTLLTYMKEHKIGVPRLAARIKEAVHRNPEIPVKTLQRFMKGEVRTLDMHVGFLAQFAEKVSKIDAAPRLGSALNAFYLSGDKVDWAGVFEAETTVTFDEPLAGLKGTKDPTRIEIRRDQGAWRATETCLHRGSAKSIFDGAMTSSGGAIVIVSKHRLTGFPRLITVSKQSGDIFEGSVNEAYLLQEFRANVSPYKTYIQTAKMVMRR